MNGESSSRVVRTFLQLFAVSCALNLLALFVFGAASSPDQLDADAREYFELAGDLLHGTYEFDARRVLGHAFILSWFRRITGDDLLALQAAVTVVFSLAAPLTYLLARRFTTQKFVAVGAGVATVFWPTFLFYGRTLYSETTALPLFLAFLVSLPAGARLAPRLDSGATASAPVWRWLTAGALLAACMLVRPMYLLFTPFLPFIVWLEDGRTRQTSIRVLALVLGCGLTLLPWSLYASTQAGRPILLSANGGETLSGGLNPALLDGGYREVVTPDGRRTWTGPGKWVDESASGYLSPDELALPRVERDRLLTERTLRWVVAHPGAALRLEGAKLAYMWGLHPLWNGVRQTLLGNVPILLLVAWGLVAAVRLRRSWRQLSMLWMLPWFTSVVALISWGSWRFRQPADIGLLILGALLVGSLLRPHEPVVAGGPSNTT